MTKKPTYVIIALIAIALVAFAIWAFRHRAHEILPTGQVAYTCATNNINATYGTNEVTLQLSDGRSFTLTQVTSGSGIRYEQGAGTKNDIVFESVGDTASLDENGTQTYTDCIANTGSSAPANAATTTVQTFVDGTGTFQFAYPGEFRVTSEGPGYTQDWAFNASAQGLVLARVDIPQSFEPNTNFSEARFTVGTSADPQAVASCLVSPGPMATQATTTLSGTDFATFTYTDAGAGQRYVVTAYHTLRNNQCYAIEEFIHYGVLENYPQGTVQAFDQAKVQQALDTMARSFTFLQ